MKRKIVSIDQNKCNGCGLCIDACHEGALELVDGKAKLVSESYCDGLGDCLPQCPTGAITIEEREADPFDEEAVSARMEQINSNHKNNYDQKQTRDLEEEKSTLPCGCPGTQSRTINRSKQQNSSKVQSNNNPSPLESQLKQWPVQIKLVPPKAPYLENANLLVAADCTSYAYANFHNDFMKNKITIIGCPKLDSVDYTDKLTEILKANNIKSVTVVRMEVPCCGGIVNAVKQALLNSEKMIPWRVVTIGTDGAILDD